MNNCIFCKIINKDIPSYKVYEDGDYFAFLDIRPRNPGHTLVIPKKHYRWVWDVDNLGQYWEVAGKIANAIKRAFKTDYVVSLVLGEEVPHAHIWLVPRFQNDGHGGAIDVDNIKKLSEKDMQDAMNRIKQALDS